MLDGSGRGMPAISVLFEPKRGGRCCSLAGVTHHVKRLKTRSPNLTPFEAAFELQNAYRRGDVLVVPVTPEVGFNSVRCSGDASRQLCRAVV